MLESNHRHLVLGFQSVCTKHECIQHPLLHTNEPVYGIASGKYDDELPLAMLSSNYLVHQ